MKRNELPMTELDASLFNYSNNDLGAIVATAEASTVRFVRCQRLYADAADEGIALRSPRTGTVLRFYLLRIERDNDGDTQSWHFQNVNSASPVELVTIFND